MKERIVFKTESSIKGRKEIAKINEYVNNFNFDCAFERKVEQVPENWEELKELCKQTGHYAINIIKGDGAFFRENIFIFGLTFRCNGDIEDIEGSIVVENRTPQQMWQIIKNLIGEE